ncbi:UDP-N-acetylglucosamine 2-epimerase (non-hydrolyzing) [Desulfoluna limicola]|uniref:UDP-N-acetylglucosamine 2-epimerase (Non-hydrolyzing) n=1 Tax=Desulfoluna limicola TaxID=2810562 RepID=A0ABM7PBV0_9BACT|nr:UDP-N-acetylglucosamine 2-epimerase (non-hydrolyzing) [Desulfoluna limicola]BCS94671.1 UDP-N-acetylglucosamine 2-epimerase (non-hydrolyzing) [Desulfoluna limicola]
MKKIIHLIAAARPNFMKIAPLYHALSLETWAIPVIVHTGQHYDENMFASFFKDLNLPKPHISLGIGSGTHAEQTGRVMIAYEKTLMEARPDLVVVVGDVNSTVACTLAAVKLGIKVAHLEAGLRSGDRSMPEEINRVITDAVADYLWTPSPDGDENLLREGISAKKITRVGNIMIDSLVMMTPAIREEKEAKKKGLPPGKYGVVTLHRPSNVDDESKLMALADTLKRVSEKIPMVFPVHPRTENKLKEYCIWDQLINTPNMTFLEPLSYKSFMSLVFDCRLVITDSGGLQEETSFLRIPCFTLRPNTERPVTVIEGTNILTTADRLLDDISNINAKAINVNKKIHLWDGRAAERVVKNIKCLLDIRLASTEGSLG